MKSKSAKKGELLSVTKHYIVNHPHNIAIKLLVTFHFESMHSLITQVYKWNNNRGRTKAGKKVLGRFTWIRCNRVSCSCSFVSGLLFGTDGSGFCIDTRRFAELATASWFTIGSHPLSVGLGGAGADWLNTIGDISSDGVTVAGIRCGEMTCSQRTVHYKWAIHNQRNFMRHSIEPREGTRYTH